MPQPNGTFVFLFEWSWKDVAKECEEWLGPKGFRAVRVSPHMEHLAGDEWYVRYQPVTYNITSRSGDEADFVSMVQRCRSAGVDLYVDVVINHMAAGNGVSFLGTPFGHRRYPIYGPDDFHHAYHDTTWNCAITDYQNKTNVQYCDLLGLPDLCTACPHVRETVSAHINHLFGLGVAGFRVDAAKHQDADELRGLLNYVDPGMYRFLEIVEGINEAVEVSEYLPDMGDVTQFAYSWKVTPILKGAGTLRDLVDLGRVMQTLTPSENAVVFIDNHDTQRTAAPLTYKDGATYALANVFMLALPYGYPMLMSSYQFSDFGEGPPRLAVHSDQGTDRCGDIKGNTGWVCEHRWKQITNMVAWRNNVTGKSMTAFQGKDDDTLAFCRGPNGCVALNRNPEEPWHAILMLTLPPGSYCDVLRSDEPATCQPVVVDAKGMAKVMVPPLGAVALHVGVMALPKAKEPSLQLVKYSLLTAGTVAALLACFWAGRASSSPAVSSLAAPLKSTDLPLPLSQPGGNGESVYPSMA